MVESFHFRNFKVLRDAQLRVGRVTLIVGPNGSGKTTALRAIEAMARQNPIDVSHVKSVDSDAQVPEVSAHWGSSMANLVVAVKWMPNPSLHESFSGPVAPTEEQRRIAYAHLRGFRYFALNPPSIAAQVSLVPNVELTEQGSQLAGVLDRLRDQHPERFEALNEEIGRWLPEFDCILFDTPNQGNRSFLLRVRSGGHAVPATELSEGTLLALALLTLAYLPSPPTILGLEEPDRGIHPRLLRRVQDALYRLAYPDSFGDNRAPVQVIATTHSPYLLDLFRDHPDEVVIAQREGMSARFDRLSDLGNIEEILQGAPLGEVWYTGILGGVPAET